VVTSGTAMKISGAYKINVVPDEIKKHNPKRIYQSNIAL